MIVQHMVTIVYGHLQLGIIALGGYMFRFAFMSYEDGFTCDLQEGTISQATYAGMFPIISSQTDRASCLETMDQVFDIEDINGDGFITRCEDATLQHAFGSSKEYSFKFSSAFDRASFRKICEENFPY